MFEQHFAEKSLPIESTAAAEPDSPPKPKKRNSGRTGPTTPAGRARSAQNSLKHGACSLTLILSSEDEGAWRLLLARWCKTYQPEDDSLEYDFVRKAAQAEWFRIRTRRNYDTYLDTLSSRAPMNWTPKETKKHDLHLRYKNDAERAFQRDLRALQQHYKFVSQFLKPTTAASAVPEPKSSAPPPGPIFVVDDKDSPTGYTVISEIIDGQEITTPRPFTPPNPLPPDWIDFHLPPDSPA